MIRSMRTVLCRTLLGVLDDRRINVFSVAKSSIPIADLKRLLEFGSPLSSEEVPKDWCNGERGWPSHRSRRRGKSIKLLQKGSTTGHRCKGVKTCHPCR